MLNGDRQRIYGRRPDKRSAIRHLQTRRVAAAPYPASMPWDFRHKKALLAQGFYYRSVSNHTLLADQQASRYQHRDESKQDRTTTYYPETK